MLNKQKIQTAIEINPERVKTLQDISTTAQKITADKSYRRQLSELTGLKPARLDNKTFPIIINAIKAGNYVDTAAQLVGISPTLLKRYLEKGSQEYLQIQDELDEGTLEENEVQLSIYAQLFMVTSQANAESQADLIAMITKAGKSQWAAAAWLLERRHGKQFGKPANVTTSKEIKHTVKTIVDPIKRASSDDEFLALAAGQRQREETRTMKITETTSGEK